MSQIITFTVRFKSAGQRNLADRIPAGFEVLKRGKGYLFCRSTMHLVHFSKFWCGLQKRWPGTKIVSIS
jgi:hypothetical protein